MASETAHLLVKHLRNLSSAARLDSLPDSELVQRFAAQRDEDAFAALVRRHGLMVLRVCQRVLHDAHSAEDVFQAVFLVLSLKAASLRRADTVGCWLHGVAYRLALKARTQSARQRMHEGQIAVEKHAEAPLAELTVCEAQEIVDEELARLPEKYRAPLVLCCLDGKTRDEAARQLGWSAKLVKSRLEQGRERLRSRLSHRGLTVPAALVATLLAEQAAPAALPAALLRAAVQAATSGAANDLAPSVALLAEGALRGTGTVKVKVIAGLLFLLGVFAAGIGAFARPRPAANPTKLNAETPEQPRPVENKRVRKDRFGDALPEGAVARLGTARLRHTAMTNDAVFTPDGKIAIVSDYSGEVIFWDTATGREVRRLRVEDGGWYLPLAISGDGKILAAGGQGRFSLWDVASGKKLSQTLVPGRGICQLLLTPDGKTLALHDDFASILLWDVVGNKKLHDLNGHEQAVTHLALSPDGKMLASVSCRERHICLWDVASGKEKARIVTHEDGNTCVAFSPDGKMLASAGGAGLWLWDASTGKKLRQVPRSPLIFAFFPDGETMAGVERDNRVHIYDVVRGKDLRQYDTPSGCLGSSGGSGQYFARLAVSPDGKRVVTLGRRANAFDLGDAARGKLLHADSGHRGNITDLAFAVDGRTLFSSARSYVFESVLAWDAATGELRGQFGKEDEGWSETLAPSPDGKLLAAGWKNLILWDGVSRKEVRRLASESYLRSVSWSADGKTLVSSSGDCGAATIQVWDPTSGKQRREIARYKWGMHDVVLSPDGTMVAAISLGTIFLWATDTGKELRRIVTPQGPVTLAFSPDSSTLASRGSEGEICLWEPTTGRLLRRWDTKPSQNGRLVFSRDGRTLVSGHNDSSVRLWEVASGTERACFLGHRGAVDAVAISRDGRRIASGGADTTILVWNVTGETRPDAALSAKQLQALWADLIGADAGRAYRAMWQMALTPKQALPFLDARLHSAAPPDALWQKQIERLLADLDSESFAVRQQAEGKLEKMGPTIKPELRKALESKPSLEARRRIERVLEKTAGWSGEHLRTLRALEAIEHMDTPEARRLLESLANGAPRAWLTEEARKSRQRLDR